VAEVDGRTITEREVDERIASVPRLAGSELHTPLGRSRMLQQVIEEEVLYLAAQEEGIADDAGVRQQVEDYRRQVVVQAYLDQKQEEATRVTEKEARAFYEAHRTDYATEKALRVRMLLVNEEKTLTSVRRMLDGGALPFADACAG
jgi:peptidyl-prolyl cis-trans isomerase C